MRKKKDTDGIESTEKRTDVLMIDALHEAAPRFKPGTRVRATIIGWDEKTKDAAVVIHRKSELPADCTVEVSEYVEDDHGKYRATLADES